jgi:hypothetical protein
MPYLFRRPDRRQGRVGGGLPGASPIPPETLPPGSILSAFPRRINRAAAVAYIASIVSLAVPAPPAGQPLPEGQRAITNRRAAPVRIISRVGGGLPGADGVPAESLPPGSILSARPRAFQRAAAVAYNASIVALAVPPPPAAQPLPPGTQAIVNRRREPVRTIARVGGGLPGADAVITAAALPPGVQAVTNRRDPSLRIIPRHSAGGGPSDSIETLPEGRQPGQPLRVAARAPNDVYRVVGRIPPPDGAPPPALPPGAQTITNRRPPPVRIIFRVGGGLPGVDVTPPTDQALPPGAQAITNRRLELVRITRHAQGGSLGAAIELLPEGRQPAQPLRIGVRPPSDVYQILGRIPPPGIPPEALPPGQDIDSNRPRGAPRAGTEAYDALLSTAPPAGPPQPLPPGAQTVSGPRLAPLRASGEALSVTGRIPPPPAAAPEALPPGQDLDGNRPRGAPRAGVEAYDALQSTPPPVGPPELLPPGQDVDSNRPRAALRAGADAYDALQSTPPPAAAPEALPPGGDTVSRPRLAPLRASGDALRVSGRIPPPDVIFPLPEGKGLLPDRAPGPRRAAVRAYWSDNLLSVPAPALPPGTNAVSQPSPGRRLPRPQGWSERTARLDPLPPGEIEAPHPGTVLFLGPIRTTRLLSPERTVWSWPIRTTREA